MTDNEKKVKAMKALEQKGVKIAVLGCACCGSPAFKLNIDGETIINYEEDFTFNMFKEGEARFQWCEGDK